MSASVQTLDCPYELLALVTPGSSKEASSVEKAVGDWLEQHSGSRVEALLSEIMGLVSETQKPTTEARVDFPTAVAAAQFARILPWSLPVPELTAEADGELSFDWFGPSKKMFSVSVNRRGRIAYAGRFGEDSKVHGTEQLSETCPEEVIRGIRRATR